MMEAAIIGFGRMGQHVLKAIEDHPLLRKIHLVDPNPADAFPADSRFVKHKDCEQILADPEVRLVFITSPNHTHGELAIRALGAGKAVMLEKPMANTLRESEEIVRAAEAKQAFLQVGFELRYSKLYSTVKDWCAAGLLGDIVNTHCLYICSEFHGKNSWRNDTDSGGSMFGEKLCHYVDLPRWWTGSEIVEVQAVSAPNVVPYYQVNDNYHCTWKHASGAVGHLSFVMYLAETYEGDPLDNAVTLQADDGHELRYLVIGTKGAAETNVFRRLIRRWEFGDSEKCMTSKIVEKLTWKEDEDHRFFHDTTTQARDIVERVFHGRKPYTPARDSLNTMAVVDAVDRAVATGKPVIPAVFSHAGLDS
jgi:predicted dehydrogenase